MELEDGNHRAEVQNPASMPHGLLQLDVVQQLAVKSWLRQYDKPTRSDDYCNTTVLAASKFQPVSCPIVSSYFRLGGHGWGYRPASSGSFQPQYLFASLHPWPPQPEPSITAENNKPLCEPAQTSETRCYATREQKTKPAFPKAVCILPLR